MQFFVMGYQLLKNVPKLYWNNNKSINTKSLFDCELKKINYIPWDPLKTTAIFFGNIFRLLESIYVVFACPEGFRIPGE